MEFSQENKSQGQESVGQIGKTEKTENTKISAGSKASEQNQAVQF